MEVQFASTRREVRVARQELRVELAKLNNLRTEVTTDRGLFVTQAVYDADQQRLFDQIKGLRGSRQGGLDAAWGYLIGALGVALLGLDVVLRATGH